MIKSELVFRIANQNPHLFNRDIEKIVNAIFGEIEAALLGVIGLSYAALAHSS